MISVSRLKELLDYNPDSGIFTWKVDRRGPASKGSLAGTNNTEGYIHIYVDNRKYKAHRLAWLYMTGSLPEEQLDHINGIKSDNRFINLREVSNADNLKNKPLYSNNISGVQGVTIRNGKWWSRIRSSGKLYNLGLFEDKFEAICARKSAEVKHGFHCNHGRSV